MNQLWNFIVPCGRCGEETDIASINFSSDGDVFITSNCYKCKLENHYKTNFDLIKDKADLGVVFS